MDYWIECIQAALEEAGLEASDEQVEMMASVVSGAHDNYYQVLGIEVK